MSAHMHDCQTMYNILFVYMVGRNGDVRLSGGGATFKGRVEVLYKDNWNTVCDDEWTPSNTDVVCKQLDYDAGVKVAWFGPGSGTILLDSVQCVGNEPNLLECRHNGFFNTNCKHTEDVGVECKSVIYIIIRMYIESDVPQCTVEPV